MIRNLIFDIGGVIIDDGNGPLARVLNLSPGKLSVLKGLLYNNPRWSEGVMLGKITQHNYMLEMIKKIPRMGRRNQEMFVLGVPAGDSADFNE